MGWSTILGQHQRQARIIGHFIMGFRRWFPSQKAINAENVIMSWRHQIKTGKGVCVCVCVGGGGGGGGGVWLYMSCFLRQSSSCFNIHVVIKHCENNWCVLFIYSYIFKVVDRP